MLALVLVRKVSPGISYGRKLGKGESRSDHASIDSDLALIFCYSKVFNHIVDVSTLISLSFVLQGLVIRTGRCS